LQKQNRRDINSGRYRTGEGDLVAEKEQERKRQWQIAWQKQNRREEDSGRNKIVEEKIVGET
jgi:hypothetical protein